MAQADAADRDLLFGVLALQKGLIDRPALVAVLHEWSLDPSASVAGRLQSRGDLDSTEVEQVRALVDLHAAELGQGQGQGLAAASTIPNHPDAAQSAATEATLAEGHGTTTLRRDPEATEPAPPLDFGPVPAGSTRADPRPNAHARHFGGGGGSNGNGNGNGHSGGNGQGRAHGQGERFRILRPHAQGGLGVVSVALDAELNREVAFKQILRHHADDDQSQARFLLEAEITGGLEHPGIVPVYSLGADAAGRPYYAMRFIRGKTLKQAIADFHADPALKADPGARSLALRELLRRFVDVCNAIDYAHGRGVLHRDLKPSNIVVGKHGETLVIDWGLAKATGRHDPGLSDEDERVLIPSVSGGSAHTLTGSALGTPSFMSPEAAAGDLHNLGPRADVYSLGATLYCILTGQSPFDGTDVIALIGQIQAGEFPRPRAVDPAVDPALEAICLKAMALEPERRYGSAHALATDVLRWSADEPVVAYPEGRRRRLSRWVRRHASLVASVGALLIGASAALALAAGLIARERDHVAEARNLLATSNANLTAAVDGGDKARRDAEAGYLIARQAVARQLIDISQYELPNIPRADKLRLDLAEKAVGFYRLFHARQPENAPIRGELARVEEQVGSLYRMAGKYPEAREHYEAARALLRPETVGGMRQLGSREYMANIEDQVGELIRMSGGPISESEPHYREAATLAAGLSREHPGIHRFASLEARVNNDLAHLMVTAGRLDEAEPIAILAARQGRAFEASTAEKFPNDELVLPLSLGAYPTVMAAKGRPEAEPAAQELVKVLRKRVEAKPDMVDAKSLLAKALDELARVIAADPARRAEALVLQDEAVNLMGPLIADHPTVTFFPAILASLRSSRGATRAALGQFDEAKGDLDHARSFFEAQADQNPGATPPEMVARATADLARLELGRKNLAEARRLFGEAIELHGKALAIDPGAGINEQLRRGVQAELDALGQSP